MAKRLAWTGKRSPFNRLWNKLPLIRMKMIRDRRSRMFRSTLALVTLLAAASICPVVPSRIRAQSITDRIVSEHVRVSLPAEREWLGRDVVTDLERCWRYTNAATGEKLPRRIVVDLNWETSGVKATLEGWIQIGMKTPAAAFDERSFLLRSAARQIARLGLLNLTRGTALREESEFLVEGMSEIVAREYFRTSRGLAGAWVHAQMLDRMGRLGLAVQGDWPGFSGGRHDLREASPGITFVLTCRELYGRERTMKLFDALQRGSLSGSIVEVFKTSPAALEAAWLKKVRSATISDSIPSSPDEEPPKLDKAVCAAAARTGLQLRLFVRKGVSALLPQGIYLPDDLSGRVYQAGQPAGKEATYFPIDVPMDPAKRSDPFSYRVLAVDEAGSVSIWQGSCTPPQ
jgi:hypothetical protein